MRTVKTVTTRDIEQLWQLAFSEPAKAKTPAGMDECIESGQKMNIIYNGGDLTLFAHVARPDFTRPGMDMVVGRATEERHVSRLLMQYTGFDLAGVKRYNWQEPVHEARSRAGIKLARKNNGEMTPIILMMPEVVKDPSGLFLSRYLIGGELTPENMRDSMQWIYHTGKSLENLAATHNAYTRMKD